MANTNIAALYPEFWFQSFDALDEGVYEFQNQVSRDTESLLAKAGDTVNVPLTPDMGEADDWTPGSAITPTGITQLTAAVVLNQSKKKTIGLTGKELSLTPYDLIEKYGVPMAKTIIRAVNQSIYLEALKTNQIIDATGGIDEDDIIDAKTLLDNNEVAKGGRVMVCSADDIGTLLKKDAFQYANNSGDGGKAMNEGLLIRKFGFSLSENSIIEKYTPADLTGAVNLLAGYAAGSTSMLVDGFADAANPVRVGDAFKFTGTPTWYTVTDTDVDTDGNTTSIDFYPALAATQANDTVITVTASKSCIGMVPSAIAFAARAYAAIPVGVQSAIYNYKGLPIRIIVWVDSSTLNVNVQYDILYGAKMINPLRVARIITV